jgi:hypothetical protein
MSGVFSSPKPPAPPPLPAPPPGPNNLEARERAAEERLRRLRAGGRQSTILTGPQGAPGGKNLLGQ